MEHGISEVKGLGAERDAQECVMVAERWVEEIQKAVKNEIQAEEDGELCAWDDVKGGSLKVKDVKAARKEDVGYMKERRIWSERSVEEY